MFNPLVSIVIPVYNGANYMAEAIDSALAQTYKNIEIIVVNDGSNDNGETEKTALSYGDKIRYFYKENGGVSSALNLGIEKMQGDYFSWLSHDDLYFENKIESQINRLENIDDKYNTVVISSGILIDGCGKEIVHTKDKIDKTMTGLERFHSYVNGCKYNGLAFLVPKAVFDKYGNFDTSMRYLQDLDMWLRLMYTDIMFIQNSDIITKARVHSMQVTKVQYDRFTIESKELYKKSIKVLSTLEPIEKRIAFLKEFYRLTIRDNSKENGEMVLAELKKNGCSYNPVATKIYFFLYNTLKKVYKKWFNKFRKS